MSEAARLFDTVSAGKTLRDERRGSLAIGAGDEGPAGEGSYYFNARWYDATTGRFITEDPVRDGENWFSYAANNPLVFLDPTGLEATLNYVSSPEAWDQLFVYNRGQGGFQSFSEAGIEVGHEFADEDIILSTLGEGEYLELQGGASNSRLTVGQAIFGVGSVLGKANVAAAEMEAQRASLLWNIGQKADKMRPLLSMAVSVVPVLGDLKDIQEALTGYDLIAGETIGGAGRVVTLAAMALPFVGGSLLRNAGSEVTGQLHHAVSRRVGAALEEHPNLRGLYKTRDARFVTRAADGAAHRGYQAWHRALDLEIVDWIRANPDMTGPEFERYLRSLHEGPVLSQRFPEGLP